jgi:DNA-binding NarL/FixJ family response regulator
VLLADDQPLIRAGLTMVIADAPGLEVVAEASSGAEAMRLAAEAHADVVVISMLIKLGARDRIQLVVMAHEVGLV